MDRKFKFFLSALLVLLFTMQLGNCFGANLTLNEFREICDIPDSVTIPSELQSFVTTGGPTIIKSQDGSKITIYPTGKFASDMGTNNSYYVNFRGDFKFVSTGSSPNSYYYFIPNLGYLYNPSSDYLLKAYVYYPSSQTFTGDTWIYWRRGYTVDQTYWWTTKFGLTINANTETDTQFKSLANLKSFLNNNLLFAGYNKLTYGGTDVLYRFNGVYAGDDVYNSKFTTNLDNFKFNYEAYSPGQNYSVVNYYYLQKFAPNEAIQLTDQDIAHWSADNWFYNRDRTTEFSFSTLIDKMETGYIYRLRAFSNQHNASGDLIRTSDATSQFFSLNSWKSSEIEVLNIYELLFTDNPSIEDTGGGPSSGGGVIDITEIEQGIGNLNNSINDLNNFFSGDIGENNSGELDEALKVEIDVEDPTADFFTWFFEQLKECFTVNSNQQLNFSILDNNFTINSDDYILDIPILKTVIGFGSGIFILYGIFKDIRREIEKIKEGKFEQIASEDITANMM